MLNIKLIKEEITQGKNLDIYVTILVAFIAFVLSALGIVEEKIINSLILVVLCLLVNTSLQNRYHIKNNVSNSNSSVDFTKHFPKGFDNHFNNATFMYIIGVTLNRTTITYYSDIEKKIKRCDKIRVLMVDPNKMGCKMALMRHRANDDLENLKQMIKGSIKRLCFLRELKPNNLEIRLINNPLGYGAYAFDIDKAEGEIYIENYPFKTKNGSLPKYVINPTNKEWYEFYKTEIKLLWEHAKPFNCDALVKK